MNKSPSMPSAPKPQRILVVRLDRIGDVVLSTPVIQALREAFPQAFIAMMVRSACQEILEGNPYCNQILLYDKEGIHRSAWQTLKYAMGLRKWQFDTALVLHPSNRSHWMPFLAGIPVRVGYDRKQPWLLTHRVPHNKQEGAYHEAEYSLQLLQVFGVKAKEPRLSLAVSVQAMKRLEERLAAASIGPQDVVVAIHPSASCVSKRWMPERFAAVADRLIKERGAKICIVAGKEDAAVAGQVAQAMHSPAVNLAGQLTLGELAALMRRSKLLISNDSGPVHIAAAVGTPVVDIFGRNERGLSPKRWGPLGAGHRVIHKEVGCVTCLAHRCDIQFLCLTEITPENVYEAALAVIR